VIVKDGDTESLYVSERIDERVVEKPREAVIRADLGESHISFRANAKAAPYLDSDVQTASAYAATAHQVDSLNGFGLMPATANGGAAKAVVGVGAVSAMQGFQGSRVLYAGKLLISTMGDEVVALDSSTGASVGAPAGRTEEHPRRLLRHRADRRGFRRHRRDTRRDVVRLDVKTGTVRAACWCTDPRAADRDEWLDLRRHRGRPARRDPDRRQWNHRLAVGRRPSRNAIRL
jgi:hypothetical protein